MTDLEKKDKSDAPPEAAQPTETPGRTSAPEPAVPARKRGRPRKTPAPAAPAPEKPPEKPPEPKEKLTVTVAGKELTVEATAAAVWSASFAVGVEEAIIIKRTGRLLSEHQRKAGVSAHALLADKYGMTVGAYLPEVMLAMFLMDLWLGGPQGETAEEYQKKQPPAAPAAPAAAQQPEPPAPAAP